MKDGVFFIKPILTIDCFKNNFLYAGTFDKAAISTLATDVYSCNFYCVT